MRIIDFADGAQSETTPTIGNIVASALVQYPDDATYEANEQGAPATGNLYYNTTLNLIRYYNGSAWISLVDESSAQTVTNKSIDADNNTITNIDNDEIKTGAAIDVTKLHDGSVDNTEFGHLDGVTSNIQTQIDAKQETSEKGQPNGYAGLDGSGTVPAAQLPSYVDDVEEYADLASFPATGETGKIYVALDTNLTYRWTGSTYVEIGNPAATPQENVALLNTEDLTWVVGSGGNTTVASQLNNVSNFAIAPNEEVGFTFTPSQSGALTVFTTILQDNGLGNGDGLMTAKLYATSAGAPTGSVLDTSSALDTVNLTNQTGVDVNHNFVFPGGVNLTAGTTYFISYLSTDTGSLFCKRGGVDEPNSENYITNALPPPDWALAAIQETLYHDVQVNAAATNQLTLPNDIYLSVPPLPKEYHTIQAQTINMVNGQAAYVSIDRAAVATTNLTVTVDDITNITPDDNIIIFARCEDDKPFVGLHDTKDASAISASSMATLTDVDLTGLADGDILSYNNSTSMWEPGAAFSTSIDVPVAEEWSQYTPVFNSGFTIGTGAEATQEIYSRRVGDSREIRGIVALGSTGFSMGSGNFSFTLPSGETIDDTKSGDVATFGFAHYGFATIFDSGTGNTYSYTVKRAGTATNRFELFFSAGGTPAVGVSATVPFTFGQSDRIEFICTVPIAGATSTEPINITNGDPLPIGGLSDVDGSVTPNTGDRLVYDGSEWVPEGGGQSFHLATSGQSIPNNVFTPIDMNVIDSNTLDYGTIQTTAFRYTANEKVQISTNFQFLYTVGVNVGTQFIAAIRKNGTSTWTLDNRFAESINARNYAPGGSFEIILEAGDYVEFLVYQNSGSNLAVNTGTGLNFIQISEKKVF